MRYNCPVFFVVFTLLMLINSSSMAINKAEDSCQALNTSEQVKKILPYPSQIIRVKSVGGLKPR